MPDTILDTMDSWKRVGGSVDDMGVFTPFVHDKAVAAALVQMTALLGDLLKAVQAVDADTKDAVTKLTGIRARLDGGIKTQAGTIAVNI